MKFATTRISSSVASSADSRLVPATHVVAVVHGTRTVLLDPRRGRYYGLDEVGGRIWALALKERSVREIVRLLVEEFDVDPSTLEHVVGEVLETLRVKGLVVRK